MIRFFRKIHLWLSVPFGIIIALVCFSGAMLIFEPEITRSAQSNVYYTTEIKDNPLPMEELMETVKASLPDSVSITGVTVFADKNRTYQVNLSKPRRSSIFIDQYSGVITGKNERIGFFGTMFKLHRWLLDSASLQGKGVKTGKLLVGISTLIFVIALISGIIIWWPRAKNNLAKSLSIPFSKGWKGFWNGLHVAGGMYAVVFLLAMALTGLTWSFDWYRSAFYAVCGVENTPRVLTSSLSTVKKDERGGRNGDRNSGNHGKNCGERDLEGRQHSEFGKWQMVYESLKSQNPEAPQITIGAENASVTLSNYGNGRATDKYEYNRQSGKVSKTASYSQAASADKLRGWIYSIHTGSWGGILTRILWFLSALLGTSLPLTGYYIWIKHLIREKKNSK